MQAVRGKDTAPEMMVRKTAHRLGYRFRLHLKDLPGKPDLVFPGKRLCLFVHGCFWHRHPGCTRSSFPETNRNFWEEKFRKNVERDKQVLAQLRELGWRVEIIWQCETKNQAALEKKLLGILE